MNGCIILNTIAFCISYFGQSETLTLTLDGLNYFFAFVFFLEVVAKLLAFGWRTCFQITWFQFDFFIVFMSTTEIFYKVIQMGMATNNEGSDNDNGGSGDSGK